MAIGSSSSENPSTPVATHRFDLANPRGASIDTQFIERLADGWLVGGSSEATKEAWMGRLDNSGAISWQYVRPLENEDQAALKLQLGTHPTFRAAVVVRDGTTFVCGNMPRTPGKSAPGIFSKIDAGGKVVAEKLVLLSGAAGISLATFSTCKRWNDNIVAVGNAGGAYWVVLMDDRGQVLWQTAVPAQAARAGSTFEGTVAVLRDGVLTVSATDNSQTEIYQVAPDGNLLRQRAFPGRYLLAQNSGPAGVGEGFKLFGKGQADAPGASAVLHLDASLVETSRTVAAAADSFSARSVFMADDKSWVGFGSLSHPGGRLTAACLHSSADLRHQSVCEIDPSNPSRGGTVRAAAPGTRSGEYEVALPWVSATAPGQARGASVYAVNLKVD